MNVSRHKIGVREEMEIRAHGFTHCVEKLEEAKHEGQVDAEGAEGGVLAEVVVLTAAGEAMMVVVVVVAERKAREVMTGVVVVVEREAASTVEVETVLLRWAVGVEVAVVEGREEEKEDAAALP